MSLQAIQPYKLPILTSQLHPAAYLIFRNKWEIQHFPFFLTCNYHWEILYKPHCEWCWVKFTHTGHVILQLIPYKLWSKILLWAFQPYELPILTSQLHPVQRSYLQIGCHTPTLSLEKGRYSKFFIVPNLQLPLGNFIWTTLPVVLN